MTFQLCNNILPKLQDFASSEDIEVQERANSAAILVDLLQTQFNDTILNANHTTNDILDDIEISDPLKEQKSKSKFPQLAIEIIQEIALLFDGELLPVAPKAQRKVPVPDGLDLDEWINSPPVEEDKDSDSDASEHDKEQLFVKGNSHSNELRRKKSEELPPEEVARRKEVRRLEQMHNPHYLKPSENHHSNRNEYTSVDNIPIAELALEIPIEIQSKKFLNDFKYKRL